MAGSTWPALVAGNKAKASEVESKFDWLEGSLVPMNSGASTDAVFDIGTTTAAWKNAYFTGFVAVGSGTSASTPSLWYRTTGGNQGGINFQSSAGAVYLDLVYAGQASTGVRFIMQASIGTVMYLGQTGGTGLAPSYSFREASAVGLGRAVGTSGSLRLFGGGVSYLEFDHTGVIFRPIATTGGTVNLGDATNYWADVSYKTLTDRGCLAWLDEGVECADGTVTTDTKAIAKIKKHPTGKKTVYGKPMLDYKSFPKICYKPAAVQKFDPITKNPLVDKTGRPVMEVCKRDENDQPFWFHPKTGERLPASDGVEMTSVFSLMIGAIKELTERVSALEAGTR